MKSSPLSKRMTNFVSSLIFVGVVIAPLSIVLAQPFRPGGGGGGPMGMGGPMGPGGQNNGNQPMTEWQFMGMAPPPDGKKVTLSKPDQDRYDEYVKNFNAGQGGGGQGGPGGGGGFGGPGGFSGGPGFGGPNGPGRPPFGPGGPGGPFGRGGPMGPMGPHGPGGPGGPFGPGGPNSAAGGTGDTDYNSADYSTGNGNQEAIAMVNEVIGDGNYSPQEKVALKAAAPEIAREFVHEEEVRAGYTSYNGPSQQFSVNQQYSTSIKMTSCFGNIISLMSLTILFQLFP